MRASDHSTRGGTTRDCAIRVAATRGGRTRARRLLALVASSSLLILSVSCAKDPREETRQKLQTLSSWAGAIRLLGEAWLERSVPSRYAQKTLHEAREALREEAQNIQQSSSIPADARATLAEHIRNLDGLTSALWEQVQTGDPTYTPQMLAKIEQEQQAVDALARAAGAPAR